MKFYSGFSLSNDIKLFDAYLKVSDYTVAGFSYGAIKAFKEVLATKSRVDTLQLFSPAFFQNKSDTFRRTQKIYFSKDKKSYLENFSSACFLPAKMDDKIVLEGGSAQELDELLDFVWKGDELQSLCKRGITVEVYLGSEDQIIDTKKVKEFFLPYATTYMINHAGHTLQTKTDEGE